MPVGPFEVEMPVRGQHCTADHELIEQSNRLIITYIIIIVIYAWPVQISYKWTAFVVMSMQEMVLP